MHTIPRTPYILLPALLLVLVLSPVLAIADTGAFPLNPGSSWTYRDAGGNLETLALSGIVERKGIPLIQASYDGNKPFYYILAEDGVYRLQPAPGTTPEAPRGELTLMIQWPLEPGQTWQSPWSDPPLSFTVLDRGPVTVAAGKFRNTLKIGYRRISSPIYQGYMWFDPFVGILAQEENAYRTELVSYTLSDLLPPAAVAVSGDKLAGTFKPRQVNNRTGPRSLGSRVKGVVFSAPFYLFALLVFMSVFALVMYMNAKKVEMDLQNDPVVHEGETSLASAMVREGLYDDATVILQRLTGRHPQWPDIAALLGRAYRETGKYPEACLELKRALALNPSMAKARLELVRTYLLLNEPAKALEEVETVLGDNPGFADAVYLKGEVLASIGKEDQALDSFRAALEINPGFMEARAALERMLAEKSIDD